MNVDITKKLKVTCVEFFHGYGGNALGLKRAIPGLRSIAVCERDAFVVENMASKMEKGLLDAVPIWTDVTDFPTEPFGYQQLDFFAASYPCQGFSHAGKRLGADDHRHLWPYCRGFIQRVRPLWVWLENVEGHITLGLSTVLADLEEDGYKSAFGIFSASEVGAPHQRKRVFILAQRADNNGRAGECRPKTGVGEDGIGRRRSSIGSEDVALLLLPRLEGHAGDVNGEGREPGGEIRPVTEGGLSRRQEVGHPRGEEHKGISDIGRSGVSEIGETGEGQLAESAGLRSGESADGGPESPRTYASGTVWPSRPGQAQYGWEPPRVVDDAKSRNMREQRINERQSAGQGNEPTGATVSPGEADRKIEPPLGRDPDGYPAGLDLAGLSGLSDSELAEIREWMVKGTNRTDELRMCGNGVVPATAERAFRTLYAEITGEK